MEKLSLLFHRSSCWLNCFSVFFFLSFSLFSICFSFIPISFSSCFISFSLSLSFCPSHSLPLSLSLSLSGWQQCFVKSWDTHNPPTRVKGHLTSVLSAPNKHKAAKQKICMSAHKTHTRTYSLAPTQHSKSCRSPSEGKTHHTDGAWIPPRRTRLLLLIKAQHRGTMERSGLAAQTAAIQQRAVNSRLLARETQR